MEQHQQHQQHQQQSTTINHVHGVRAVSQQDYCGPRHLPSVLPLNNLPGKHVMVTLSIGG